MDRQKFELSDDALDAVCGGDMLSNIAGTICGVINMGCSALGLGAPLSMAGGSGSGSGTGSGGPHSGVAPQNTLM